MTAKVKKLICDNIKNIEHIEMEANDTINFIAWNNWSGKTTLIEAIFQTLRLKDYAKSDDAWKLIKQGEDNGQIFLILDWNGTEVKATRTFDREKGTKLTIETIDWSKLPATLVQGWLWDFTVDPLAFSRMKPAEQIDVLKKIAGIDTDKLDEQIEETYDQRRLLNTKERELRAIVEKYADIESVWERRSLVELAEKKQEIMERNQKVTNARERVEDCERTIENIESNIRDLESQLKLEKWRLQEYQHRRAEAVETASLDLKETADIDQQIATVEEHNEKVYAWQKHQERIKQHSDAKQESEDADSKLAELRDEKMRLFQEAWLPINDLSFDEEWNILIWGIPFDQHSTAEKIRISTDLATHDKPELRVLYIQDGSLLDDEMMKIISEISKERDYQIFVEVVGENKEKPNAIVLRQWSVLFDNQNNHD